MLRPRLPLKDFLQTLHCIDPLLLTRLSERLLRGEITYGTSTVFLSWMVFNRRERRSGHTVGEENGEIDKLLVKL